jgi:uncharacterized protein YdhG (YjbR/CyaY superfamily)
VQNFSNINDYIASFPENIQLILKKFRSVIHDIVPDATEAITYGIPTFKLNGKNLVHFGAFKDHTSFFPTSSGVSNFKDELKNFEISKGTIKFPLDKEIPWDLISKITKFRVKEVTK